MKSVIIMTLVKLVSTGVNIIISGVLHFVFHSMFEYQVSNYTLHFANSPYSIYQSQNEALFTFPSQVFFHYWITLLARLSLLCLGVKILLCKHINKFSFFYPVKKLLFLLLIESVGCSREKDFGCRCVKRYLFHFLGRLARHSMKKLQRFVLWLTFSADYKDK